MKKITGSDMDKTNLYKLAEGAGYKVTYTQADAEAVTAKDGKVILIDEHLADAWHTIINNYFDEIIIGRLPN